MKDNKTKMTLNSCCCCFSLRTGCIIIAVLDILYATGFLSIGASAGTIINGVVLIVASVALIYAAVKVNLFN